MASASVVLSGTSKFSTALGNKELTLELDAEGVQLTIELVDATRFVIYRHVINKPENIRQMTGTLILSLGFPRWG